MASRRSNSPWRCTAKAAGKPLHGLARPLSPASLLAARPSSPPVDTRPGIAAGQDLVGGDCGAERGQLQAPLQATLRWHEPTARGRSGLRSGVRKPAYQGNLECFGKIGEWFNRSNPYGACCMNWPSAAGIHSRLARPSSSAQPPHTAGRPQGCCPAWTGQQPPAPRGPTSPCLATTACHNALPELET